MQYTNTIKKWFRRLIIGVGILVVFSLVISFVVRLTAVHKAERNFPPPGQLIEFDGRLSHIHCVGSGTPTIILESGLDDKGTWGWLHMLDELSKISRVCAYDRAGFIWSETREGPRDAEQIAYELHTLLGGASESPPYVYVGHSLGGLYGMVYDNLYPNEIAGFVFVDASHPEQDYRFPPEVRQKIEQRKQEPDYRWLYRLMAPYRIFAPERATARTAYWWRSFPEGVMGEGREINPTSEQAARNDSFGIRPVVVLTAGKALAMPGLSDDLNADMRRIWLELQEELALLSTNSDHRIIGGAGHYIHRDRPEEVEKAIKDVVMAIRDEKSVTGQETVPTNDKEMNTNERLEQGLDNKNINPS